MTKMNFRVTSIELDPDEDVTAVRAMATAEAARVIAGFGGIEPPSVPVGPDGPRLMTFSVPQIMKLHEATGKIRGDDPVYPVTTEIYDSLCMVIYGLIED